jgi:preprotein translocase subunit SecG
MSWLLYALLIPFMFVALFLVLVVLIQRGRGGGLAGAFGGGGAQTAFGAKTGDVLTWVTAATFGIFLVLCVSLNLTAQTVSKELKGATGAASSGAGKPASSTPAQAPTTAPAAPAGPESAPTTAPSN